MCSVAIPDTIRDEAAVTAGRLWRQRRVRSRGRRGRRVTDFLIAAHAMAQADVFLSRDRGFYHGDFSLRIIDPSIERDV
jgi:predicted nucleic acid-binding protein